MPYRPGLDGMRALAVVAVMVYHANSDWLPGGFIGVEVFFVISGYLITLLLIGEHERTGRINLGRFWLRRARRLLPAFFLMLVLLISYTALFERDALGQLRGDVLAGGGYVANWYQIWVGQGYTADSAFAPLRHLWSLSVEEQFYLLWPVVMVLLVRRGHRRLPDLSRWLMVVAAAITVAVTLLYHPGREVSVAATPEAYWFIGERAFSKNDTLYLSTITRCTGLLIGASFAMIWRPVAVMRGPLRNKGLGLDVLCVVGLTSLAALCWYLELVTPQGAGPMVFRGGLFAVGIATIFVVAAVTHGATWSGAVLGHPLFRWVGTRSYGLYLYHWPIYQIIRKAAGNPLTLTEFALALFVTAFLAEISYRFVEMPVRRRRLGPWWQKLRHRRDPIPRRIVGFGMAGSVALVAFAGASMATAELTLTEQEVAQRDGAEVVVDLGAELRRSSTSGAVVPSTSTNESPPTTRVSESTVPTETTEPTETTDVVETTEPTETTDVVETTEPTETTDAIETTEPTETTDAIETTEPTETTDVVETTEPTETTDVVETTEPTETTDVVETTEPTETTDVVETTEPTETTDVVETTEPTETTDVVETTEPTEPTDVVETTEPTETTDAATTTTDAATTTTTDVAITTTDAATTTTDAATTTTDSTAAPATAAPVSAPPAPAEPQVFQAIGDSVMLGAAVDLGERGIAVDAQQSRQMADYVPTVQALAAQDLLGSTVIVHLGTNGSFSESTMHAFFDALVAVDHVIVLTVHADRGYTARNNELLWTLPERYSNVTMIDWNTLVGQCEGTCLYDDGIHLPPAGRRYYAQLIFDAAGL